MEVIGKYKKKNTILKKCISLANEFVLLVNNVADHPSPLKKEL